MGEQRRGSSVTIDFGIEHKSTGTQEYKTSRGRKERNDWERRDGRTNLFVCAQSPDTVCHGEDPAKKDGSVGLPVRGAGPPATYNSRHTNKKRRVHPSRPQSAVSGLLREDGFGCRTCWGPDFFWIGISSSATLKSFAVSG